MKKEAGDIRRKQIIFAEKKYRTRMGIQDGVTVPLKDIEMEVLGLSEAEMEEAHNG